MIQWIPIDEQSQDALSPIHPIVVINLKERNDRLNDFIQSWQFFGPLKEKQVAFLQMPAFVHKSTVLLNDSKVFFKNGCTASHAQIMHAMIQKGVPQWTVLEDDAQMADRVRFEDIFRKSIANPSILRTYGLIQWGPSTLRSKNSELQLEVVPWSRDFFLSKNALATHALSMSRSFAHRALDSIIQNCSLPIDNILFQKMQIQMAVPQIVPIVLQSAGYSDVEQHDVNYAKQWAAVLRDRKSFQKNNESSIQLIDESLDPFNSILKIQNGSLSSILTQIFLFLSTRKAKLEKKLEIWGLQNEDQQKVFRNIQFSHHTLVLQSPKDLTQNISEIPFWTFSKDPVIEVAFLILLDSLRLQSDLSIGLFNDPVAFLHIKGGPSIHNWTIAKERFRGCQVVRRNIVEAIQKFPKETCFRIFTDDLSYCKQQVDIESCLAKLGVSQEWSSTCRDESNDQDPLENQSEALILEAMLRCSKGGISSQSKLSQWAAALGQKTQEKNILFQEDAPLYVFL